MLDLDWDKTGLFWGGTNQTFFPLCLVLLFFVFLGCIATRVLEGQEPRYWVRANMGGCKKIGFDQLK